MHQLERLYRRRTQVYEVFSYQLADQMVAAAWEIDRPVGVLVHGGGKVTHVVVGSPGEIVLPELR